MVSDLCSTHLLMVVSSDEHTTLMRDSRQETVSHATRLYTCKKFVAFGVPCRCLLHFAMEHNVEATELPGLFEHGLELCSSTACFDNERYNMFVSWLGNVVEHTGQQEIQPFTFPPPINQTTNKSITNYEKLSQAILLNLDAPAFQQTEFPEGLVTSHADILLKLQARVGKELFQPPTLVSNGPWQCDKQEENYSATHRQTKVTLFTMSYGGISELLSGPEICNVQCLRLQDNRPSNAAVFGEPSEEVIHECIP
ncbi:hypothetical protein CSKR_201619 [Clonorchis sinensis]|uniref:Uncharacterized protein n=1 Tax=Clonorchis sinensis TaxID=79923 RepID=A0A8T1MTD8_CLOSI|nr:hypothetical protein CSKR_201619 [Clonorchis sinensis]